jgi:hypothetical protein
VGLKTIVYLCLMIENRFIHIKTGKLHFLDEVYDSVVFTMDSKCFPINEVRNLSIKEKETLLVNHICNSWNDETVKKISNRIKKYGKIKTTKPIGIKSNPSWMRKIVSYLSRLKRRVCN